MSKEKKCYGSEIVIANTRLPISWAVEAGDYVFLSGCASLDENLVPAMNCGIEEQTTNTLEMMKRVLAEADCGLEDLVKMNVFLKNKADFQGYNTTASKYFLEKRLPSQPAKIVPAILARPISEIATAPRAEVVVIPIECRTPPGMIGPHISVTKAGKCAVTKAS